VDKETLTDLSEHITSSLDQMILGVDMAFGELSLTVRADQIKSVLAFLRDDPTCRFIVLIDICGVDYPSRTPRFDVVYHLLSMHQNQRLRVKISTDEATAVPSVVDVFPAANWFEREAFDLYGILFSDHPDLRRLLTDYGFQGHPEASPGPQDARPLFQPFIDMMENYRALQK